MNHVKIVSHCYYFCVFFIPLLNLYLHLIHIFYMQFLTVGSVCLGDSGFLKLFFLFLIGVNPPSFLLLDLSLHLWGILLIIFSVSILLLCIRLSFYFEVIIQVCRNIDYRNFLLFKTKTLFLFWWILRVHQVIKNFISSSQFWTFVNFLFFFFNFLSQSGNLFLKIWTFSGLIIVLGVQLFLNPLSFFNIYF